MLVLRAWVRRPKEDRTLVELVVRRLRWALLALLVLLIIATAGYVVIDHYGVLDAVYMAVITMSTVGYGEVHRLDSAGRLFTTGIIILGFATFVYAVATLTNLFTSGEAAQHLRVLKGRRMRAELNDHVIVVGFGRVGRAVADGVRRFNRACVVMDRDAQCEQPIYDAGCVPMIGDATDEKDLVEAGIERAHALVAAADQDDTNLIVTLTARALRQDLHIVSRVNEESWRKRMESAGADVAQSPYVSYGMSLAASAITPSVLDVHDLPLLGLGTEDVVVEARSQLVGRSLDDVSSEHNVFILGLRREERLHRWDEVRDTIRAGDVLVALGTSEQLRSLGAEAGVPA